MNVPISFIIILIILVVWYYIFTYAHPDLESEFLSILLRDKKFKTGDMILFKAIDNFYAPLIASYYGHIGIVWIYPDDPEQIPYIFEAADPTNLVLENHHNPKGIYVSLLETRIKQYKGYSFYKELHASINKETCRDFEKFINYCMENMEYNTSVFSNGISKGLFGEKINHKVNCGELVFLSLIKLNLLDEKEYDCTTFHHLKWMCNITDLYDDENYYEEPKKILYSPF